MMLTVFTFSLRQLATRQRLFLLVLLSVLPLALALIFGISSQDDRTMNPRIITTVIEGIVISGVLPIGVMSVATAALGNEYEDRTLSVLVLTPISRMTIVLSKLAASIAISAPPIVVAGGVIVIATLVDGDLGAVFAVMIALLSGIIAYSAVFTWAGLMTNHALGFGLVYVLLWEGLMANFLDGGRYLSVRSYTLGILHGIDSQTFNSLGSRVIEFPVAIVGIVLLTIVFTVLTVHRLQTMDVP